MFNPLENDRVATLDAKANIVGFGTTTAGIGTFRFLTTGQPPGNERSARFESTFNVGTGTSISYANLDKTLDSSIKSLIKVSTGQTSAIHQVVAISDASDIMVVQYPYVSLGSTSGIEFRPTARVVIRVISYFCLFRKYMDRTVHI